MLLFKLLCASIIVMMIKFPTHASSQTSGTFPREEKQLLLDLHNDFRRHGSVVTAANMIELTWDEDLAKIGQDHAKTCLWGHQVYGEYGQNIYIGSRNTRDAIKGSMKGWADDEIDRHRNQLLVEARSGQRSLGKRQRADHVTQILWARTRKVGCGYARCNRGIYVVCNYFPPGNYRGMPIFRAGRQCSQCPKGMTCNNGLCSNEVKVSSEGDSSSLSSTDESFPVSNSVDTTSSEAISSDDINSENSDYIHGDDTGAAASRAKNVMVLVLAMLTGRTLLSLI